MMISLFGVVATHTTQNAHTFFVSCFETIYNKMLSEMNNTIGFGAFVHLSSARIPLGTAFVLGHIW